MALTDKLTAIANAIRAKTGGTATMTLAEMPTEIASIQTGITPSGSITLTSENTYDVTEKASAIVDFSATRANLAEAVTAKGVDTLPTSSFDTIATNIGLISGGGGLPSSISKIDGGSFTVSNDLVCTSHISHNLGGFPKGFAIWTDDTVADSKGLKLCALIYAPFVGVSIQQAIRLIETGGSAEITHYAFKESELGLCVGIDYLAVGHNNLFYKPNYEYKWIAWA